MDTQMVKRAASKLSPQLVNQLLPARSQEEWEATRQSFLDRGYVECSLCDGLVAPAFQRSVTFGDQPVMVALCPDRRGTHRAKLGPARLAALLSAFAAAGQPTPDPEPDPASVDRAQVVDLETKRQSRKA